MNDTLLVLWLATGMVVLRSSGLLVGNVQIPASWERVWRFVPLALLSALVVSGLHGRPGEEAGIRTAALVVAAGLTFRYRRLWLCIVSGMAVYLALRTIT